MSLRGLSRNSSIGLQLSRLLEQEKVVHAFLFVGSDSESRRQLGFAFAKALLCPESKDDSCDGCTACRKFDDGNHEDMILIEKPDDKTTITVPQVEELQERLKYRPYGHIYAVVIDESQNMNQQAQNKLLKLLEEPPVQVVFILLADSADSLLSTVVSRCSCYYLNESAEKERSPYYDDAARLIMLTLSKEAFYKKRDCFKTVLDSDDARDQAMEFLDIYEELLLKAAVKASASGFNEQIVCIKQAENALNDSRRYLRLGQNAAYTIKQLCLRV